MASITFPSSLGGDGRTYSDDANPTTGLANGGHRTRFIPTLQGTVAMAASAQGSAQQAAGSVTAAKGYLDAIQELSSEIGVGILPQVRPTLSFNFIDEVYRVYEA
jgi:hypothetical protein